MGCRINFPSNFLSKISFPMKTSIIPINKISPGMEIPRSNRASDISIERGIVKTVNKTALSNAKKNNKIAKTAMGIANPNSVSRVATKYTLIAMNKAARK